MGKQLMFAAGVAVGYVLGARAGRERYEAIMRSMRELKERPEFQETAGRRDRAGRSDRRISWLTGRGT